MKKLLIALAALPFMAGVAAAGQPLTDKQMDKVTAGYFAWSWADAQGLAGESGFVVTATASLSEVAPYARRSFFEATSTLYKAVSAAQSATFTTTYDPSPVPGTSLPFVPPPTAGQ